MSPYFDADKDCSLASLYDPLSMPPDLVKAHAKLDALVDKAYGRTFANDAERVAHLFRLYAESVEKLKSGKVEKCESGSGKVEQCGKEGE